MKRERNLSIRFNEEEIKRIEIVANELKISKSKLIRNFVFSAIEIINDDISLYLSIFEIQKCLNELRDFIKSQKPQTPEERP